MIVTVTPAATVRYVDAASKATLTASSNSGAVTWSVLSYPAGSGPGTLVVVSSLVRDWFFPNRAGTYVIRAADSGGNVDKTITVQSILPITPNWDYDVDMDDKENISRSEDNYLMFRVKGGTTRSWNLPFPRRPLSDFTLINDFWEYHKKYKYFYWEDIGLGQLPILVHFNAGLKVTSNGPNEVTITCVIEEVKVG